MPVVDLTVAMHEYIDPRHLDFLIRESSLTATEQEILREEMRGDATARGTVAEELEDTMGAGLAARLDFSYEHRGSTAVHLWSVPGLEQLEAIEFESNLSDALESDGLSQHARHPGVQPPKETGEYISWAVRDGDDYRVAVNLFEVDEKEVQGYIVETLNAKEVIVVVPEGCFSGRSSGRYALRAYAGDRDARQAVKALLRDVAGYEVLDDSEARLTSVADHVALREHEFVELGDQSGFEWYAVAGDDPLGRLGHLGMEAQQMNGRYESLDADDERVSLQQQVANDERGYQFDFEHVDGYVESVQVRAYFHQYPHVTFSGKTSLPAMESLLRRIEDKAR
ncbi:MAG: hypothetical protein ACQEVA_23155 [Myxococcota bacterium]